MLLRLWLSLQGWEAERQSNQCVFCSLVALNLRGQAGASSVPHPASVLEGVGAQRALRRWKARWAPGPWMVLAYLVALWRCPAHLGT